MTAADTANKGEPPGALPNLNICCCCHFFLLLLKIRGFLLKNLTPNL